MTTPIQPDLGPHRPPPPILNEDPLLIWYQYGLENLFFLIGERFGEDTLDGVLPRIDAIQYATMQAVSKAKDRLRVYRESHPPICTPVGIRLDTSRLGPLRDDDPCP